MLVCPVLSYLWDFLVGGNLESESPPTTPVSSWGVPRAVSESLAPHSACPQILFTIFPFLGWGQVCFPHPRRQWHKRQKPEQGLQDLCSAQSFWEDLSLSWAGHPRTLGGNRSPWDTFGWCGVSSWALLTCFGFGVMQTFFSFSRPIQTWLIKVHHNYLLSRVSSLKFCPLWTPSHFFPAWRLARCHLSTPQLRPDLGWPFFLPGLLRNNWHTSLCELKVHYGFIYIYYDCSSRFSYNPSSQIYNKRKRENLSL